MKYYCGIDLHARDSMLCVIDDKEKIHLREKVPNHLPIISNELSSFSPKPSVVLESTLNGYWLVDGLQEAGYEVKLTHSPALHMITAAKVKTDRKDAFALPAPAGIRTSAVVAHRLLSSLRDVASHGRQPASMRGGCVLRRGGVEAFPPPFFSTRNDTYITPHPRMNGKW